jgi:hypothetical protein
MKLVLKPLLILIYLKPCISYPQTLYNKFQKSTTDLHYLIKTRTIS